MTNHNETTEQIIEHLGAKIAEAAKTHRVVELRQLVPKLTHALDLEQEERSVKSRLQTLRENVANQTGNDESSRSIRRLIVHVTQGMINQNLLTLSDQIRKGWIRIGDTMHIKALPSGDEFETVVLATGNKLQERGKIGRFYKDAHVKVGDVVELLHLGNHHWQLKRLDPQEYHMLKLKALEMI
jgi:hypothetical protein